MLISSYKERMARKAHKQNVILSFLRDETWSNAEVLSGLICCTKTAVYKTLRKMERDDYISSFLIRDLHLTIWGITPHGLAHAWSDEELMEPRPRFEPGKVAVSTVHHHLDVQRARINAEKQGWTNWIPGPRLPRNIKKRPDAVATNLSGQIIAVEMERSIKAHRRYESIISTYLQMINQGEYAMVHYVCPDEGFSRRLTRVLSLIKSVPVAGERVAIKDKHRARFPIFSLDNWP